MLCGLIKTVLKFLFTLTMKEREREREREIEERERDRDPLTPARSSSYMKK